ncbi:hypothetical protein [Nocardioides sp. zg-DK7169]|uniref:hypothetical protein n=1 Tax=Nocardioides sp. zg-DK7169 TaxID=2736600 RepID=UPI001551D57D|nr:hypothetical protein [Nocardioides sp. zg-DK7169]NPC99007.1 hypothetical protein [Nocardioides sp. zg-DK7169]
MSRRVSLPSADDLFRPTVPQAEATPPRPPAVRAVPDAVPDRAPATDAADAGAADAGAVDAAKPARKPRKPSGRVRHDEKMTVYVTSEELLEIEHARLALRRSHGLAVDRGRLVREAVSLVLADLEANGEDSILVRRLSEG